MSGTPPSFIPNLPIIPDATDVAAPDVSKISDLYLRKWNLSVFASVEGATAGTAAGGFEGTSDRPPSAPLVISTEQKGFDLRIHFTIKQGDFQTPNTAIITVYNLADEHARKIIKEYDRVELQAGYIGGHYGLIFAGQIKQYKLGRENAIDSYLTIYAADGIVPYTQAKISAYVDGNPSQKQLLDALTRNMKGQYPALGVGQEPLKYAGGVLPRGRPFFGATVDELRDWAKTNGCSWSIQDGKLVIYNQRQYNANQIVVLTARTGMVGVPESTQEGILVQCFINPAIKVRGRILLDNKSINTYYVPGGQQEAIGAAKPIPFNAAFPGFSDVHYYATTSRDGVYVVLVLDMEGDTRGLPWYMWLTCWSVDITAPLVDAVQGINVDPQAPAETPPAPSGF